MCVNTLLGDVMVQALHLGVVPQQVQALAVGLPQELHPRSEQQAIGTILSVLSTHSTQENTKVTTSLVLKVKPVNCITQSSDKTIRLDSVFSICKLNNIQLLILKPLYASPKHILHLTFDHPHLSGVWMLSRSSISRTICWDSPLAVSVFSSASFR